ncbi:sugar ABC transporter substrate-binding protein [Aliifodinibius sp. S!AR15-10]|uniref:ABC transporter substrate-binding protein n=1 Tax=Aliifodinibius sp. S!AR15-10 TaxID=2950437 RepID=UPI0028595033|nr:sugar ABC transporter substrate-binding protein [Aliifodinibius sp. S!AR15-10]MDR8391183.1 sugar ABC transporter substrate-binding protein [Aliifodinibius sp. S!AR15-10]
MTMQNDTLRVAVRTFEPFETALQKIWEAYCQKTGCKLKLEAVPMELADLHSKTLGEGGLKKGEWDIAYLNTDWLAEAHATGSVLDLNSHIEENPPQDYPEGWSDSLLGLQAFGDEVVGLPFHDGPECLVYRKDLFEDEDERQQFYDQYGWELKPPETWEEYLTIARFFQRPEEDLYGTVFAAYPDGHNTVFDFSLQLWTRGGEIVDSEGNININTAEARKGLEFYRSMLQDDTAVHPNCPEFDSVKAGLAFARGNVAMMVNWFGFAALCEVHEESTTKGKVDVTTIPRGPSGEEVSLNVYWVYAIGARSSHKEIAYDFIRFAVNAQNDKFLTLEGGIGCRRSTWRDEEVNRTVPYYHRLEELHRSARELPRRNDWSEIAGVIDQVVLDVMNTDQPVAQILENGQREIEQIALA